MSPKPIAGSFNEHTQPVSPFDICPLAIIKRQASGAKAVIASPYTRNCLSVNKQKKNAKWTKQLNFNPLNTKRSLLYLKTQFVPRNEHFSSRL